MFLIIKQIKQIFRDRIKWTTREKMRMEGPIQRASLSVVDPSKHSFLIAKHHLPNWFTQKC